MSEERSETENEIVVESTEATIEAGTEEIEKPSGEDEIQDAEKESKPETEQKPEDPAESKEKDTEKPKRKTRAQKRIERQQKRIKELEDALAQKKQEPEDEVSIDDFDTYDEYEEALKKREGEAGQKVEAPKPDPRIGYLLEDGAEVYDDFEAAVTANDLVISQDLLEEILESDKAPEVAYYLAGNKKEAESISNMAPRQIAREVAKIELKLSGKPKPKIKTDAPPPIDPVSGTSSNAKSIDDDDLSFEEHEKMLNESKRSSNGWL